MVMAAAAHTAEADMEVAWTAAAAAAMVEAEEGVNMVEVKAVEAMVAEKVDFVQLQSISKGAGASMSMCGTACTLRSTKCGVNVQRNQTCQKCRKRQDECQNIGALRYLVARCGCCLC